MKNGQERSCFHPVLSNDAERRTKWLDKDSEPFKVVTAIALDKFLIKALLKRNSELEVYHNAMLKYTQKHRHYKHETMEAQTKLAVMDHNENVNHPQATTADGKY
ncbi:hypothetical protein SKAU_G00286030 [Synaphobranchus kaupii]|uniref:Uncharacterized protein n=1 Tax=Synaphobranchus kaupii TaxID=118154 RepID=A0A9Q1EY36_SYNKA|nr:hypothetical protein SKAU_G00286030 [Synaphobranchus kaupii]